MAAISRHENDINSLPAAAKTGINSVGQIGVNNWMLDVEAVSGR